MRPQVEEMYLKDLILSGGHGTKLRPITYFQQKQHIPAGNKSILLSGFEDVIDAGVKTIGIYQSQVSFSMRRPRTRSLELYSYHRFFKH